MTSALTNQRRVFKASLTQTEQVSDDFTRKICPLDFTYCHINGEDFVNFCGLLRKHELYHSLVFRFIAMPNFWIQYLIGWTNNGIRLWTDFWSTRGTISFLWSVYLPLSSRKKTPISSIGLTIFIVSLLPQCLVKLSISLLLRTGLLTSEFFFLSYFSFKMQSMQVALYSITSVLPNLEFANN